MTGKWDRLRFTNPGLWQRRQETLEGIRATLDRFQELRQENTMEERMEMARELLGDLAGEVEAHHDGSITVHVVTRH